MTTAHEEEPEAGDQREPLPRPPTDSTGSSRGFLRSRWR
jgi:hypothetical protein